MSQIFNFLYRPIPGRERLPDVAVRIKAAFALAHLNLGADTPTDALKAAALDSNRFVAIWSKEALRIIVSKQAEGVSDDLRK